MQFFTDSDSDLRKNRAFQGKVFFLEVALKLKDLHFTLTAQVVPVGPLEDTYDSYFWVLTFSFNSKTVIQIRGNFSWVLIAQY
jgi:hypothetical protein